VVVPVLVQGENAAADIARAIKDVNSWNGADTIIVGRGGGSIEDLWAFNEEIVARAIFESEIPVISAVGHETDFTIADFVADMRAPTPSAAAELAIPAASNFKDILKNLGERMNRSMSNRLSEKKLAFDRLINTNVFKYPLEGITDSEIYVYELYKRLERAVTTKNERCAMEYRRLSEGLERLSPLGIMSKGYSLVYNSEGKLIKSCADTAVGDTVEIKLSDGSVKAKITAD
jgi:exodeoxyribonuclease VII large subunit